LFFFAALMFAVMLLFLWMARGYTYVSGTAATDAAAAAESPHAHDDESALLSSYQSNSLQEHST
jgi:uncharacterized protein (UPF0333 family)